MMNTQIENFAFRLKLQSPVLFKSFKTHINTRGKNVHLEGVGHNCPGQFIIKQVQWGGKRIHSFHYNHTQLNNGNQEERRHLINHKSQFPILYQRSTYHPIAI